MEDVTLRCVPTKQTWICLVAKHTVLKFPLAMVLCGRSLHDHFVPSIRRHFAPNQRFVWWLRSCLPLRSEITLCSWKEKTIERNGSNPYQPALMLFLPQVIIEKSYSLKLFCIISFSTISWIFSLQDVSSRVGEFPLSRWRDYNPGLSHTTQCKSECEKFLWRGLL